MYIRHINLLSVLHTESALREGQRTFVQRPARVVRGRRRLRVKGTQGSHAERPPVPTYSYTHTGSMHSNMPHRPLTIRGVGLS